MDELRPSDESLDVVFNRAVARGLPPPLAPKKPNDKLPSSMPVSGKSTSTSLSTTRNKFMSTPNNTDFTVSSQHPSLNETKTRFSSPQKTIQSHEFDDPPPVQSDADPWRTLLDVTQMDPDNPQEITFESISRSPSLASHSSDPQWPEAVATIKRRLQKIAELSAKPESHYVPLNRHQSRITDKPKIKVVFDGAHEDAIECLMALIPFGYLPSQIERQRISEERIEDEEPTNRGRLKMTDIRVMIQDTYVLSFERKRPQSSEMSWAGMKQMDSEISRMMLSSIPKEACVVVFEGSLRRNGQNSKSWEELTAIKSKLHTLGFRTLDTLHVLDTVSTVVEHVLKFMEYGCFLFEHFISSHGPPARLVELSAPTAGLRMFTISPFLNEIQREQAVIKAIDTKDWEGWAPSDLSSGQALYSIFLSKIKGMSANKAVPIVHKFPTPCDLSDAFRGHHKDYETGDDAEQAIACMTFHVNGNESRKAATIGPKMACALRVLFEGQQHDAKECSVKPASKVSKRKKKIKVQKDDDSGDEREKKRKKTKRKEVVKDEGYNTDDAEVFKEDWEQSRRDMDDERYG